MAKTRMTASAETAATRQRQEQDARPANIMRILPLAVSSAARVKRGITGAKQKTGDEFLVKKKDPLILPPDFENLPEPSESSSQTEEIESFEKTLGGISTESTETENSSSSKGTEQSILDQIRKQ